MDKFAHRFRRDGAVEGGHRAEQGAVQKQIEFKDAAVGRLDRIVDGVVFGQSFRIIFRCACAIG